MESGKWEVKYNNQLSIFHFPFSTFHFQFPIFNFPFPKAQASASCIPPLLLYRRAQEPTVQCLRAEAADKDRT